MPSLRPYVRTILDSGNSLLRLLTDALDMSRAEAGVLTLEPAPLDLDAVAADLRDRLGHATTMMASNAAQAGIDRADIADTMGHTAMELTARASMAAGTTGAHAVGHHPGRQFGGGDETGETAAYDHRVCPFRHAVASPIVGAA